MKISLPGIHYNVRKKSLGEDEAKALVQSFLTMPSMEKVKALFDKLPATWSPITRLATALSRVSDPKTYGDAIESVGAGVGIPLTDIDSYVTLQVDPAAKVFKILVSRSSLAYQTLDQEFAAKMGWEVVGYAEYGW